MSDSPHPFNRPEFNLKKPRFRKRLFIIIAATIVLLATAGSILYFFRESLFGIKQSTTSSQQGQGGGIDEVALSKTTAAVSTYMAKGDTTAAVQVIDKAIQQTNSSAQKSALYHNKATVMAATDTPAAIKAAEQSVLANPNFENTAYLAELYERNGDKEKAIEYYGKTIVLFNQLPRAEENGAVDASLYQERIDRLRAQ